MTDVYNGVDLTLNARLRMERSCGAAEHRHEVVALRRSWGK